MRRTFAAVWVLASCAALPAVARAEAPVLHTDEYGDWSRAVEALQRDTQAEGRVVHAHVTDGTVRLGCEDYHLDFDAVGAEAFEIGGCDRAGTTALRLVHRDALFDHGDVIPHPRAVTIAITQTRHASEVGRAADGAGSDLHCSLGVRPYVNDLEHGTRVYLSPGRFALRVITAGATVEPATDGWTVHGGEVSVSYEVVDTLRAMAVVVRDQVRLECEHTHVESSTPSAIRALPAWAPAAPGATHVQIEAARPTEDFGGSVVRVNGVTCAIPCDLQLSGRNRLSWGAYGGRHHARTDWTEQGHTDFDVTTGTPMRIAVSADLMRERRNAWVTPSVVGFAMILCVAPGIFILPSGLGGHDEGLTATGLALLGTSAVGVTLLAVGFAHSSSASPVASIGPRFASRGGVQFEGLGVAPVLGGAAAGVTLRF